MVKPLTDQLRKHIADSGISPAQICRDTGIQKATLSRFMSAERGLSMPALDQLVQYFNLELRKK